VASQPRKGFRLRCVGLVVGVVASALLVGACGGSRPAGAAQPSSVSPRVSDPTPSERAGKGVPTYLPLPSPPSRVDWSHLVARINRRESCPRLATPGYLWETLRSPDCWNTDFGNIHGYSEDFDFITGYSPAHHAAVLIYNSPNGPIHAVRLPTLGHHPNISSVHAPFVCVANRRRSAATLAVNFVGRKPIYGSHRHC
jgi:hypothetical protein